MMTIQSSKQYTATETPPRASASGSASATPFDASVTDRGLADRFFVGRYEPTAAEFAAGRWSYKVQVGGQEMIAHVARLAGEPMRVWEMAEEDYKRELAFLEPDLESLKRKHSLPPSEADHARSFEESQKSPALMTYATITIAGQVVATIDNQGVIMTADSLLRERLRGLLPDGMYSTNGPDLAQARADVIAKLTGGRVNKSATAISQRAFESLPPLTPPQGTIDWAGLREEQEKLQAQAKVLKQKRAEYLAPQQKATPSQ